MCLKMQYFSTYNSPIGEIILKSNGKALSGLFFVGQKYFNAHNVGEQKSLPIFEETHKWLDVYFSGRQPNFTPPLSLPEASPFRKRVWQILLTIPFGKTVTYGEIAKEIESETGRRASAQAVGGAVGHNPIGIIVPCHRVVGSNGALIGYAGGLDKKAALLKIERK